MKKTCLFLIVLILTSVPEKLLAFTINDTSDVVDSNPGDGYCDTDSTPDNSPCTLRAAIQETNALAGTHTMTLPAGTYVLSLVGYDDSTTNSAATGDLDISGTVTLTGAGASTTEIDAQGLEDCAVTGTNDRIFHVLSGATATLSKVTIKNGGYDSSCSMGPYFDEGGGIKNSGTLTVSEVIITDNQSERHGGGIYNEGTLAVSDSVINDNSSNYGGGIKDYRGKTTITGSTIAGNFGDESGGGIVTEEGSLSISDSTIYQNISVAGGGIIGFMPSGTISITNSTIQENAAIFAAGMGCGLATVNITNSTFSGNTVINYPSSSETDCGNLVDDDSDGNVDLADSDCTNGFNNGETGSECGDGANNDSDAYTDFDDPDCLIGTGGAISDYSLYGTNYTCNITLTNSTLSGNSAENRGGAINIFNSSLTINNGTIYDNTADSIAGGGLFIMGGSTEIRNSILAQNTSSSSPDCYGAVISRDYNVLGNQSGCTFTAATHDLIGDSAGSGIVDPLLNSLADNGGQTATHAPQTGSPALDSGNESGCTDGANLLATDQRGEERHQDATDNNVCTERCDIGAYEAEGTDPICTSTTEDCDNDTDDDGDGLTDCDDPDCSSADACATPSEDCANSTDDNGDGLTDCDDPDCTTHSSCAGSFTPSEDCDDGSDNDLDGKIDCEDEDCSTESTCEEGDATVTEEGCVSEGGDVVDVTRLKLDAQDAIRLSNGQSVSVEMNGATYTVAPVATKNDEGVMTVSISISSEYAITGGSACLTTDDEFKLRAEGGGCKCNLDGDRPLAKEFYLQLFVLGFLALLPLVASLRARWYAKRQ